MKTQPDQIQALISNIDQVLSLSNPRPPLVVLGDTVVQSRQTLEQVRQYLVNLQQQADQNTTRQPDEVKPDISRESALIRRIVRQELNLLKTQLTQTLQAEIKQLRLEHRVLIREIRQLQPQQPSPAVRSVPPSVPAVGFLASPPTPSVSGGSSEVVFPYAGVELPLEANPLPPSPVESSSISLLKDRTPNLDIAPAVEPLSKSEETDVEQSSEVIVNTETSPPARSENTEPTAAPPVDKNPFTLVDTVLSVLDFNPSPSSSQTLPTPASPEVEQQQENTTPPPMDGEDYTLASPHENLLPAEEDDDDQVDSHLLVERSTIEHLEEDLLSLERQRNSSQDTRLQLEGEENPPPASQTSSSVQQPQEEQVLSFEDLFTDVSSLDSTPVSAETSTQMTLDELIDHLNLSDDFSSSSEGDTDSSLPSLETFNPKQQP